LKKLTFHTEYSASADTFVVLCLIIEKTEQRWFPIYYK